MYVKGMEVEERPFSNKASIAEPRFRSGGGGGGAFFLSHAPPPGRGSGGRGVAIVRKRAADLLAGV